MQKKLTITVDEEVYEGLHKVIGRRKISKFVEELVRPHVVRRSLEEGYAQKAKDEDRETEAMNLSIEERAALAERLILSLDAPSEAENLQLWVHEAERRVKELREGTSKDVPAEEVFRRARAAIS